MNRLVIGVIDKCHIVPKTLKRLFLKLLVLHVRYVLWHQRGNLKFKDNSENKLNPDYHP